MLRFLIAFPWVVNLQICFFCRQKMIKTHWLNKFCYFQILINFFILAKDGTGVCEWCTWKFWANYSILNTFPHFGHSNFDLTKQGIAKTSDIKIFIFLTNYPHFCTMWMFIEHLSRGNSTCTQFQICTSDTWCLITIISPTNCITGMLREIHAVSNEEDLRFRLVVISYHRYIKVYI